MKITGPARTFVVSLASDSERRQRFWAQTPVAAAQLVSAVDLRGVPLSEVAEQFDVAGFVHRYGRNPAPSEAGCTLSHLAVWRQVANDPTLAGDVVVMVCEDDAQLSPEFAHVLPGLMKGRYDVLILGHNRFTDAALEFLPIAPRVHPAPGYAAGPVWPNVQLSTMCYLLRVGAAREFLLHLRNRRPDWLADDTIMLREAGLRVWAVRPRLVTDSDAATSGIMAERTAVSDQAAATVPSIEPNAPAPSTRPRYQEYVHRRHRRKSWWFAAERLWGVLPGPLRARSNLLQLTRWIDDLVNGQWPANRRRSSHT